MNSNSENPYPGRKATIIALVDASDEAAALEETRKALHLISRKMKKGKEHTHLGMVKLKAVNQNPLN